MSWSQSLGASVLPFAMLPFAFGGVACAQGDHAPVAVEAAPQALGTGASPGANAAAAPALASDDSFASVTPAMFSPCEEDPELECGTLAVPVDYANPRGAQLQLATIRARARSAHKKGILFVNPGGPGGSGVDFVIYAKEAFAPLQRDFDIVSFDPRGIERSQSFTCEIALPQAPIRGSLLSAAAFHDAVGLRTARRCLAENGGLATKLGSANVARDMDRFRQALREHQLNYLGFSYGTILGASYASQFPERVRAMVLDGNVPPSWLGDYFVELDAEGSASAERSMQRLDQLCQASPDCALRGTGVVAAMDRVVARLDRSPVVTSAGVLRGSSLLQLAFYYLFNEADWPALVEQIAHADAGDYSGLEAFALPAQPESTFVVYSADAVMCDDFSTRLGGADYAPLQFANRATFPRFAGANVGLGVSLCASWPRPEVTPVSNLRTESPVLVLGNELDPITPMTWSRNMATALGAKARLVRYLGGGHAIYSGGSACINDAVEHYFRTLAPPAAGLVCPALPMSFAASAQRDAAEEPSMMDALSRVRAKSSRGWTARASLEKRWSSRHAGAPGAAGAL